MTDSETVLALLLQVEELDEAEFKEALAQLPPKVVRWLGTHHVDNRARRWCFEYSNVAVGEGTVLNQGLVISDGYKSLVTIGARVAVSPNVMIIAQSAPNNSRLADNPYVRDHLITESPVTIHDDAWIGAGAILLPGVVIGARAIVGAGAVVTGSVSADTIVAGVPARVVRTIAQQDSGTQTKRMS